LQQTVDVPWSVAVPAGGPLGLHVMPCGVPAHLYELNEMPAVLGQVPVAIAFTDVMQFESE
jgi:hypothetical protein